MNGQPENKRGQIMEVLSDPTLKNPEMDNFSIDRFITAANNQNPRNRGY